MELPGGTTAYWVYGDADATTTLIAVHGYRGDHHGLEPVVAFLDGVRVVSPDLPGFGETPPLRAEPGPGGARAEHTLDAYAAWLTDFVAAVAPVN